MVRSHCKCRRTCVLVLVLSFLPTAIYSLPFVFLVSDAPLAASLFNNNTLRADARTQGSALLTKAARLAVALNQRC